MRRIYLTKSADGGAHFSEPQLLITGAGLPGIPGNLKVAVDQATNQIYLTYQDYDDGNGEVRVLRVADAGDHFVVQGRTTVKTDPADQFFPLVSVAPNGRVDVCYQDKGYLPGNSLIFTTCGFSTDHALSFTNQQVTTVPFDASNNNFIGDYNWQASTNDAVYPIFVGDGVPGRRQQHAGGLRRARRRNVQQGTAAEQRVKTEGGPAALREVTHGGRESRVAGSNGAPDSVSRFAGRSSSSSTSRPTPDRAQRGRHCRTTSAPAAAADGCDRRARRSGCADPRRGGARRLRAPV
jgi:hypothetical protein